VLIHLDDEKGGAEDRAQPRQKLNEARNGGESKDIEEVGRGTRGEYEVLGKVSDGALELPDATEKHCPHMRGGEHVVSVFEL